MCIKLTDLTIGVLTFLRDDKLFNCINNLKNISIPYELHILDHGRMTPQKKVLYKSLRKRNHQVYELPFNTILGKCCKHLFNSAKTKYFLLIADDFYVRKKTVENLMKVMRELHDEKVRVVAPVLWKKTRYRYLAKKFWMKDDNVHAKVICLHAKNFEGIDFKKTKSGLRYYPSNYTSSGALYDTEIREKVNWDPKSQVIHLDFFLQLAQTKWISVTTPDAVIDHSPGGSKEYKKYRRSPRRKEGRKYIAKKWLMRGINIKTNT